MYVSKNWSLRYSCIVYNKDLNMYNNNILYGILQITYFQFLFMFLSSLERYFRSTVEFSREKSVHSISQHCQSVYSIYCQHWPSLQTSGKNHNSQVPWKTKIELFCRRSDIESSRNSFWNIWIIYIFYQH